jgi:DNA-binding transcriptional MerR regulator
VVPSVRTPAGYRGYTDADIERLHLVLVYRSVGLPLDEIRTMLVDVHADVAADLRRQHALLTEQVDRLQDTIKAVEELMTAHRKGIQLSAEEQVEIFGTTAFGGEYATDAEDRWDGTDAWKQSLQRTAAFAKDDWIQIKAEGDALFEALADAKRRGVEPGTAPADELAARHRASIGSTTAAMRCTGAWPRCTSPTNASRATTTTSNPAWRSSCATSLSKGSIPSLLRN